MDIFDLTATVTIDTGPFETAIRTMGQAAQGLSGTISSALAQAQSAASSGGYRIGAAITAGIQSGIAAGSGALYANIQSLCAGLAQAARSELGIASPSKVFEAIGGYMAQGLSEGLGAGLGETERVLTDGLARITGAGVTYGAVRYGGASGSGTAIGAMLAEYLPKIAERDAGVYLDGQSLASALAPDMDEALGRIRARGG